MLPQLFGARPLLPFLQADAARSRQIVLVVELEGAVVESRLQERNFATLLLVRVVEEQDPSFFSPEILSAAALAAANARDDLELIEKRSAYLFLRLPASLKAWARIGLLPESSLGAVILVTLAIGALSNFLGPSGLVHVVYNPLVFLIAWNVVAYSVFAWRSVYKSRMPGASEDATPGGPGVSRLLMRDLWSAWNRWANRLPPGQLRNADQIAARFRDRYWEVAGPVVLARIEWLIHTGAIFLLLGALGGTYIRGLFLEYNAIWRSTFVTDPGAVSALLNIMFAPGLLVLDRDFLSSAEVQPLLSPTGAAAAPWIHRIALTAAILIVVPRLALLLWAARRAGREGDKLRIDFGADDYYLARIRSTRDSHIHSLREEIASTLRAAVAKLAESVALFVRDRFFDRSVAPALLQFRNNGGRIIDLEAEILAASEAFQPQILQTLQSAQEEFGASVRSSLQKLVGKELARHTPELLDELSHPSVPLTQSVSGSVAGNLGDGIGVTIVLGITTIVATLSGGIGQSLGIAIVSGLLGTSGPVGLLIGGVAALVLAGAGYVAGREKVAKAIKSRHIPATIVAFALPESKLDEARQATHASVRRDVTAHLEPHVKLATEAILEKLVLAADRGSPSPGDR